MKHLLLFVFAVCSINCYSQTPNPDLFQTWYLTYLLNNDFAVPFFVADIDPAISPTLTVTEDLNFTGQAACNAYSGFFANATFDSFQTTQFAQTLLLCDAPVHTSFEGSYFDFLQSATFYQIVPVGQGLSLILYNPIFGQATFQNFSLHISDFDFGKVAIYPNPTQSRIFLNLNKLIVSQIQVINSLGQNVKTFNSDFEAIDISDLAPGVYVLKISTEVGIISRKVIKE